MAKLQNAILNALFLGLHELAPLDTPKDSVVFLRAMYHPELSDMAKSTAFQLEQSFAPYANQLQERGLSVSPEKITPSQPVQRVLFAATRFNEENLATLARAWEMLAPDGWLIAAQHNDLGAKRLDAAMKKIAPNHHVLSKFHCRAVAVQKTLDTPPEVTQWLTADAPQPVADTGLIAAPGMFSWRKIDKGSQLLIDTLPMSLAGRGADIAAGWGYLSWAILQQRNQVQNITLYEAEKRALDIAQVNLASHSDACRFVWADATRALDNQGQQYDWAVMNPPAHDMLQSAPEATVAIFMNAAKALKAGGKLYIVANRHLPYERVLDEIFASHLTISETNEFKVIEAVR
ncbi:MAG: methyltransferase [Alphaproteobacteria bacterium]|nr:methyltransferase [Alphaproteobacteria bacterium]